MMHRSDDHFISGIACIFKSHLKQNFKTFSKANQDVKNQVHVDSSAHFKQVAGCLTKSI